MGKQPRRHHFVPQCYLRVFTTNNDVLYVFPKNEREIFKARTKSLAVRNHYYSYEDEHGDLNADIERALADIEGTSKSVIDKIISQKSLTPDDKAHFSVFLGIMFSRNPNWRDGVEQGLKHFVEKFKAAMVYSDEGYEKLTRDVPDFLVKLYPTKEEMQEHLAKDYKVTIKPVASLSYVYMGLEIAKYLSEMHWRFWVKKDKHLPFLTSDNPCYVTNKAVENTPYGVGVALEGSRLHFPVSPEIILIADWFGSAIEYKDVKDKIFISRCNSRTVRYAEKEVYSSSMDKKQIKIYDNNRGFTLKTLIDEVGPYQIFRKKLARK